MTATTASTNTTLTPCEQAVIKRRPGRRPLIGLPSGANAGERRFPLTPEAAARLTGHGVTLKIEQGAGLPIHYSDNAYARAGARISSRAETLRADIVVSVAPLLPAEASSMRRGALLVTLLHSVTDHPDTARALLNAGVNVLAADIIDDGNGHRLICDILHEIDGCASIALASAILADPIDGKGILLGGVTGIVPCEVTILGSGMGAIAAAHNALGMGATVRMFDNDLYSLRNASRVLDHRAISSAMHPNVIDGAFRSADIIIVTPTRETFTASREQTESLKKRVLIFDLTCHPGQAFPAIKPAPPSDRSAIKSHTRACYYNVGSSVPRTAAMALSNALVANIDTLRDAADSLSPDHKALRPAMLLHWGKCVHPALADLLAIPLYDLNLLN